MKMIYTCLLPLFIVWNTAYGQSFREIKTPADVVENSISAMGGKAYLLSIKTLFTAIKTEMEGRQVYWVTKEMLPNKGAFQIIYNNNIVFQNWFDGTKGYEVVNGEKRKADPKEFADKKYKKNIFNELDYIDSTLWKLEMTGEEKLGEENCYKIKATCINKDYRILYFSKTSFHLLREDKYSNAGKGTGEPVYLSEFKKIGGLTCATVMKFGEGEKQQTALVVDVFINEKVSEKDFGL